MYSASYSVTDILFSRTTTILANATSISEVEVNGPVTTATRPGLTPPPRSRFLAFGDHSRQRSVTIGRSKKSLPVIEDKEGSRKKFNKLKYWDSVLLQQEQNPMFLKELTNLADASAINAPPARETLCKTSRSPRPTFPKSCDHLSLLEQSATEAEASLAKAIKSTTSSDSENSDSSLSLPPSFINTSPSSGTATSIDSCMHSSPSAYWGTHESPVENREGLERTAEMDTITEEVLARIEENFSQIAKLWKRRSSTQPMGVHTTMFSPFSPSPGAPKPPAASTLGLMAPEHVTETTASSTPDRKPEEYYIRRAQERIRAQRVTPWRRCRDDRPACSSSAAHSRYDNARAVEEHSKDWNISWPPPPPTALLRSSIPSPVPFSAPFIFEPTFDMSAVEDEETDWPSPFP